MDFGDPRRRVAAPVRCHPLQSAEVSQPPDLADSSTRPDPPPTTEQRRGRSRHQRVRADVVIWIIVAAAGLIFLERQHVPRTFFIDEWSVVLYRRSNGIHTWLDPHNGHLVLVPVVIYRVMLAIFGMNHYRPYRFVGIIAHLAVATVLYRYVRSRQGAIIAVAVGTLFLFLGSGWEVIYQPFTINSMIPAAAGIWAWSMLDRRTRNADFSATGALAIGLASGGLGICLLLGTAARLAVGREWRRLLWIVAAPAALYALWYLTFGESQGSLHNIVRLPRYIVDEAASSFAGLAGRDPLWGRIALGVAIGLSIPPLVRVVHRLRSGGYGIEQNAVDNRWISVVAPVVALLVNWLLVGYSRADLGEAESSRYVYVGVLLLLLAAADIGRPGSTPTKNAVVVVLCAIGVWGNWYALRSGPVSMRNTSAVSRVELRAVEWAAATVSPDYRVDDQRLPGVTAGVYLPAVTEFHSAAATDGEVEATDSAFGAEVDRVSLEAGRFAADPADRVSACAIPAAAGSITVRAGDSIVVTAGADPVEVRLVRYAPMAPADPQATIAPGQTETLTLPIDTAPRQEWQVDLRSSAAFEVCGPSTG
jgi:hypothetical protein